MCMYVISLGVGVPEGSRAGMCDLGMMTLSQMRVFAGVG